MRSIAACSPLRAAWPPPGDYEAPAGLFRLLREDTPRMWTGMVFRSSAMRDVKNLDETLPSQHDHDFVVRMAVRYPAIISNHPCAIYVNHSAAAHILDDSRRDFWAGSLGTATQTIVALALGLKRSVRDLSARIVGSRPSDQLTEFSLDAFPAD